jgi:hypothetical protein
MEKPIVLKLVGFVDSLHSCDQKKQNHANQIDGIEITAAWSGAQGALEAAAKIELMTKALNQEETAIVRQGI